MHAVHPTVTEIGGVPACPRLVDVPGPVDLAVIAVPATAVLATLADAADAGIPAAVVISSGFEELGEEGAAMQRAMLDLARRRSIRIVGPNCLGLMSNLPDISLDATFSGSVPPPGGLAFASQSGGVGIVLSDVARAMGLGVGSFVSLGNKADVSSNDLLAAWRDDPRVTAAALYLESFGNALKFARFARRFAERKPLLAVVGGRSAGGRRAGASHTAAAASPAVGVDALFAQAGVIACDGAEDMAETALLLVEQPLPRGTRVAVLSNAGGMGVLAADAADEHGLVVPELSPELRAKVAAPRVRHHRHRQPGRRRRRRRPRRPGRGRRPGPGLRRGRRPGRGAGRHRRRRRRPGDGPAPRPAHRAPRGPAAAGPDGRPVRTDPAARGHDVRRHDGRDALARPGGTVRRVARAPAGRGRGRVARGGAPGPASWPRACSRSPGTPTAGWTPRTSPPCSTDYDLAPEGRVVHDPVAAATAAAELGYPVAVKVADPDVVHKTDRGLVRVGMRSAPEVVAAVRDFERELGREGGAVLVQPLGAGVEIAVGVVRDPGFGPLVMVAAGGTATDLWDDRAFLLPPVTRQDAARAIRSLRTWPLLDGFRGQPRADSAALEDLVVRLGRLAEDVPQVADVDLNPVLVGPDGCVRVDVKVRLADAVPVDAGIPRRLRRTL